MARLLVWILAVMALSAMGCAESELGGPKIDADGETDAGVDAASGRRPTGVGNAVSTQVATSTSGATATSTATATATATSSDGAAAGQQTTLCQARVGTATLSMIAPASYVEAGFKTSRLTALLTTPADQDEPQDVSTEAIWSLGDKTLGTLDDQGGFTSAQIGGRAEVTVAFGGQRCTGSLVVTGSITRIPLPARVRRAVLRPGHDEVWLTSDTDAPGMITIVDTTTNTVSATIDLGYGVQPHELVFLQSGDKAYLSTSGHDAVKVIDAHARAVAKVTYTSDHGVALAVSANGKSVYFAQMSTPRGVHVIDTNTDRSRYFDKSLACPSAVAVGAGDALFVADGCSSESVRVDRLDVGLALTSGSSVPAGVESGEDESRDEAPFLAATPDGTRLFTTDRVLRASDLAPLEVLVEAARWSFFDDGRRAVAAASGYEVYDYSGAQLSLIDRLAPELTPPAGGQAAITADAILYLPLRDDEALQVLQFAP